MLLENQLAEADLTNQARATAVNLASGVQKGTKGAADQFNKFVEGSSADNSAKPTADPERKDFWDSFGAPATSTESSGPPAGAGAAKKNSSIGTSAMKKGGSNSKDEWGEW